MDEQWLVLFVMMVLPWLIIISIDIYNRYSRRKT
jgi:hypothetical protein